MFAPARRRLGEVLTGALPIHNVVDSLTVALAGYLRRAILPQVDIASQHDLDGAVHTPTALGQLGPGLVGNLSDCLTPCLPCWGVPVGGPRVAFPVVL